MNFYAQELVDHYKNPKNLGELKDPDFKTEEYNPSCGDKVQFFVCLHDDRISAISFLGFGCVISQATASMLSEYVKNIPIDEILALDAAAITNLIKLELGPTRLRCALLPLYALQKGIRAYRS